MAGKNGINWLGPVCEGYLGRESVVNYSNHFIYHPTIYSVAQTLEANDKERGVDWLEEKARVQRRGASRPASQPTGGDKGVYISWLFTNSSK